MSASGQYSTFQRMKSDEGSVKWSRDPSFRRARHGRRIRVIAIFKLGLGAPRSYRLVCYQSTYPAVSRDTVGRLSSGRPRCLGIHAACRRVLRLKYPGLK